MEKQDFEGLRALLDSTFPKTCRCCGHVYQSAEDFFVETQDMPKGHSSLRAAMEDDGLILVEVFRNCRCGSTLMDEFGCRRDASETGQKQRLAFDKLLIDLQAKQIEAELARREILKFLRGQSNCLIATLEGKTL